MREFNPEKIILHEAKMELYRFSQKTAHRVKCVWGCIQKFPDWVDNDTHNNNNNNNKHSLRSNTKGYGGKTHYTDSQNSDTTAPSGNELYHLQF
jgi:hypothetical protein